MLAKKQLKCTRITLHSDMCFFFLRSFHNFSEFFSKCLDLLFLSIKNFVCVYLCFLFLKYSVPNLISSRLFMFLIIYMYTCMYTNIYGYICMYIYHYVCIYIIVTRLCLFRNNMLITLITMLIKAHSIATILSPYCNNIVNITGTEVVFWTY